VATTKHLSRLGYATGSTTDKVASSTKLLAQRVFTTKIPDTPRYTFRPQKLGNNS